MKKFTLLLMAVAVLAAGCARRPPMYYWDNYSQSLYNLKKESTPEALAEHTEHLRAIIEKSQAKGVKPPPGVCCELGYYLLNEGKTDEAVGYLNMEMEAFPESTQLVTLLLKKAEQNEEVSQ